MPFWTRRKPVADAPAVLSLSPEEAAQLREARLEMWRRTHPLSRYEVTTYDGVHTVSAHDVKEDEVWLMFRQWKYEGWSNWPNSPSSWNVMLRVQKFRVTSVKLLEDEGDGGGV